MGWSRHLLAVGLALALAGTTRAYEETTVIDGGGTRAELNRLLASLGNDIDSAGTGLLDLQQQTAELLKDVGTFKLEAMQEATHCQQLSEWSTGLPSKFTALQDLVSNETISWNQANNALGDLLRGVETTGSKIREGLEEFGEVLGNIPQPGASENLPQPAAFASDPPRDCNEAQQRGGRTGITTIAPPHIAHQQVWCDQDTEGGGWTVIIKRQKQDPQLDFARRRADYVEGFGDLQGEHWLGLEAQDALTGNHISELLVTMAIGAEKAVSRYGLFGVGPRPDYRLSASLYDADFSTGGDSLTYHNGQAFSTTDRDRDGAMGGSCADWSGGGGWWYKYCYFANPTGLYGGGRPSTEYSDSHLEWRKWQGYSAFLTDFVMMIRPNRRSFT